MEIFCKTCGNPIDIDDINISKAIAKCSHCNKAFHITPGQFPKLSLSDVKGVEVVRIGRDININIRWFSPSAYFNAFFCVLWNYFLFQGDFLAFKPNTSLLSKIIVLPHVVVGVSLFYRVLCVFLNKTQFVIGPSELKILHKPLPWFGHGKVILQNEIDQLYVKETVHERRNIKNFKYQVRLKTKSGKDYKISNKMDSYEQARKIEQEIELALGIKDQVVQGEYI